MRKRRNLANKLILSMCAVLIAVSAFFYAPMEVEAEEIVTVEVDEGELLTDEMIESYGLSEDITGSFPADATYVSYAQFNTSTFDIASNLDDSVYYEIGFDLDCTLTLLSGGRFYCGSPTFLYDDVYIDSSVGMEQSSDGVYDYFRSTGVFRAKGSELKGGSIKLTGYLVGVSGTRTITASIDFNVNSITEISMTDDGKDFIYQQGYADGFSAGLSAEPEAETFEIDITSDMSFNNYSVSDANTLLPSVYESEFDSDDENTFNAYFYRALGVQYVFTPSKEYYGYKVSLVPMGVDYSANGMVEWVRPIIGSYTDVYSGQSGLGYSLDLSTNRTSNLWLETNYSEEDVYFGFLGYFREFVTVENTLRPEGGIAGKYRIRITPYSFDEYESATIGLQEQANILQQTGNDISQKTQDDMNTGFSDVMNSFDKSQGNAVNSDLADGLDDYQSEEGSLWVTATTGLKDFVFFDFKSIPAMLTGISFVTTIMTKWFNEAGGASGVGIVLSILFSVMLVAMVLGLYRWYQSRGGKK